MVPVPLMNISGCCCCCCRCCCCCCSVVLLFCGCVVLWLCCTVVLLLGCCFDLCHLALQLYLIGGGVNFRCPPPPPPPPPAQTPKFNPPPPPKKKKKKKKGDLGTWLVARPLSQQAKDTWAYILPPPPTLCGSLSHTLYRMHLQRLVDKHS